MKYAASGSLLAAALLSSGVYGAPQAPPAPSSSVTMNTPSNLVTCQPIMLTWSGGTAPYFLSLQDGNNFYGPALQQFAQQSATSTSWIVNVPAGKDVAFLLRDSAGQTSVTAPVTVQKGSEETCVDSNLTFAPPSATGGSLNGTSGATSIVTVGGPTQAAPAQSRASTSDSSPSAVASSSSSSSNAAPKLAVSGIVLPALAALFGIIMA
ncbi:hypothetical protein L218DRAFT_644986 [Marasmius fiardii PR-910]|nr:hypothetical protein L218DRAFT_644986 [Marasmius fiardii PR-910]